MHAHTVISTLVPICATVAALQSNYGNIQGPLLYSVMV